MFHIFLFSNESIHTVFVLLAIGANISTSGVVRYINFDRSQPWSVAMMGSCG